MNMSMKSIMIRIIMDLINLKILKQHPLVLQKRLQLGQIHIQSLKFSLQEKILKLVMLQKCLLQNLLFEVNMFESVRQSSKGFENVYSDR